MKKYAVWAVIIIVVVAGASFFAGTKFGGGQSPTRPRSTGTFGGPSGNFVRGANGNNGNNVSGTVIGKDSQSITVSLSSGGSKIVLVSPSTNVMKTTVGTSNDLSIGTEVFINGTSNPDGSLTAESVQIRPLGFVGGQRFASSSRPQ